MDSWIDVVLRGMGMVAFICMVVVAAPFIIVFALFLHTLFTS